MVFSEDDSIHELVENPKITQLVGWFEANINQNLMDAGVHDYLYQDSQSGLCGTRRILCGKYIKDTGPLVGCMLYILQLVRNSTCTFCLLR